MINAIDSYVGSRVATRRVELGLSIAAASSCLQIAPHVLLDQEAGLRRFSAQDLFALSRLLGVSVDYFYQGLHEHVKSSLGDP